MKINQDFARSEPQSTDTFISVPTTKGEKSNGKEIWLIPFFLIQKGITAIMFSATSCKI
jgi:hypothetical protein